MVDESTDYGGKIGSHLHAFILFCMSTQSNTISQERLGFLPDSRLVQLKERSTLHHSVPSMPRLETSFLEAQRRDRAGCPIPQSFLLTGAVLFSMQIDAFTGSYSG